MKLSALTLIAMAAVLAYQLMLPPVTGLADQGDYARLIGPFHLGPAAQSMEERYYRYFNRTYVHDANFKLPGWEIYSTQDIFVGAALALNQWIGNNGVFDIRVLAGVEIFAFLMACYFLVRSSGRLVSGLGRVLISLALLVIFCDTGYICYFNSFYCEPSTYIFLAALVAAWLALIADGGRRPGTLAIFAVCAVLFVASKPQNVPAGVLLSLYLWRFRNSLTPRWLAPATGTAVLAASLAVYFTAPRLPRLAQMYNMVFMDMLPRSGDKAAELRALGLDPAYAKYSGSGAFAPSTGFWSPAFQDQLDRQVSRFTIVRYYAGQPRKLWKYVRTVLARGTSLRAEGVGNFEKSAGRPPFARSWSFAIWSQFHERYLSRASAGLLAAWMLSIPFSLWLASRALDVSRRLLAECYAMLALMAVATFFTTVLGDAHDIAKHLHLYNVLTDICLIFALAAGLAWVRQNPRFAFFRNRNRSAARLPAKQKIGSMFRAAS